MNRTGEYQRAEAPKKGEPPKQAEYKDIVEFLCAYGAWERGEAPNPGRSHSFLSALENGGDWAERTYAEALEVEGWGVGQRARAREEYRRAQLQFHDALRGYVDRWLDSVLHPDGSETPYARRLLAADYSAQQGFADEYATAVLDPYGRLTFGLEAHGAGTKRLVEPFNQASLDAIVYFLNFLQSEDRFRLGKCRRCGKYIMKGRNERRFRKRYLNGIHCESCRNKVTAILSRGKSLKEFEDTWLPLAIGAYRKGQAKHIDENGLKRFIVLEVNSRLDVKGPRLKVNRVTMWWKRIVRMAEEKASVPATEAEMEDSALTCPKDHQHFGDLKNREIKRRRQTKKPTV